MYEEKEPVKKVKKEKKSNKFFHDIKLKEKVDKVKEKTKKWKNLLTITYVYDSLLKDCRRQ